MVSQDDWIAFYNKCQVVIEKAIKELDEECEIKLFWLTPELKKINDQYNWNDRKVDGVFATTGSDAFERKFNHIYWTLKAHVWNKYGMTIHFQSKNTGSVVNFIYTFDSEERMNRIQAADCLDIYYKMKNHIQSQFMSIPKNEEVAITEFPEEYSMTPATWAHCYQEISASLPGGGICMRVTTAADKKTSILERCIVRYDDSIFDLEMLEGAIE
jgi:hypothetical protein